MLNNAGLRLVTQNQTAIKSKVQMKQDNTNLQSNLADAKELPALNKTHLVHFSGLFNRTPRTNTKDLIKYINDNAPDVAFYAEKAEVKKVLTKICSRPKDLYAKTDTLYYMKDDTGNLFNIEPTEEELIENTATQLHITVYGKKDKVLKFEQTVVDYLNDFAQKNPDTYDASVATRLAAQVQTKIDASRNFVPPQMSVNQPSKDSIEDIGWEDEASNIKSDKKTDHSLLISELSNAEVEQLDKLTAKLADQINDKPDKLKALDLMIKFFEKNAKSHEEKGNINQQARCAYVIEKFSNTKEEAVKSGTLDNSDYLEEGSESAIDICSSVLKTDLRKEN